MGISGAKAARAQLVADIAAGKYGETVDPEKIRTLGDLLDEWIDHGETRGRSIPSGRRVRPEVEAGVDHDYERTGPFIADALS